MVRDQDMVIERRPDRENTYFNFYLYVDELNFFRVELIRNNNNGEHYVKELRNFDYILMVKGELDFFDVNAFTEVLKKLDALHTVLAVDIKKLKDITPLLIE